MNSLLGRNLPKVLPNADSPSALATSFLHYFNDKINKLCASILPVSKSHETLSLDSPAPIFSTFEPCTTDEVRKLIISSFDASCQLDIIPTRLLKSCIDVLMPPITRLINLSLSEGVFPDSFKHAIVTPLLKQSSLPKDDLFSYRPISNLNFVSKILEKAIY